jgi:hypothetical protein
MVSTNHGKVVLVLKLIVREELRQVAAATEADTQRIDAGGY